MTESYKGELLPPQRILLGAGPSGVNQRVLKSMTLPVIGHLDPEFFKVMDEVCVMLRKVFQTENYLTLPLSSTGTGAMEAACANILEPGDRILIFTNGYFGVRLADIAHRCRAEVIDISLEWGKPVTPEIVEDAFNKHKNIKVMGMVHGETSTGVLSPIPEISKLAHQHGSLLLVDAVTSLAGHELKIDDWDIDICYSGTQKCIGAPPGLAPITLGSRAIDIINNRPSDVQSFYFNLKGIETYWGDNRAYHHTTPISMTYALREALRMVLEEGLDNRIQRHEKVANGLRSGLNALGLDLLTQPEYQLNPLTAVKIPEGIEDTQVRSLLLKDYNIEIGGGLGDLKGKIWRIGLMGETARESNVFAVLSGLEQILGSLGYEVGSGASLAAAQQSFITG
jgi:alanine-glyoxylate transaminase/serine-glyoxylate transaminase/serine-pyruvate transaminase